VFLDDLVLHAFGAEGVAKLRDLFDRIREIEKRPRSSVEARADVLDLLDFLSAVHQFSSRFETTAPESMRMPGPIVLVR